MPVPVHTPWHTKGHCAYHPPCRGDSLAVIERLDAGLVLPGHGPVHHGRPRRLL
ncbi:hypothetical protein [Streptomyces mirabilis]|uniref:hypothetical protein n=1 Tax=Streptomyces mirabilis TaxID=68239 RepID=UPI0036BA3E0D